MATSSNDVDVYDAGHANSVRDGYRSFDGKIKVWSIDTRSCVATHSETDQAIWSVKWLPLLGGRGNNIPPASSGSGTSNMVGGGLAAGLSYTSGVTGGAAGGGISRRSESFAVARASRAISFYREATGG